MSKSNDKKNRREMAAKKEQQKQKRMTIIFAVILLTAITIVVIGIVQSLGTEVYSDDYTKVTLRSNGNFTAVFHQGKISGTYTKTADSIEFTYDGQTVSGELEENALHLPHEWDDGHGHNAILIRN